MKTRREKMETIKELLCNAVEGISYRWCRVENHNKKISLSVSIYLSY